MSNADYQPHYVNSWALIIGIDDYQHAGKLENARNDAEAIAALLVERFGFPEENVTKLFNQDATRENILRAYLSYESSESVQPDDRLIVFFAGHGYTKSIKRGEIGYLVPVDGNTNNLSTLIRWDELSQNAEVIPTKHVLIILDACFSGLIITRAMTPGASRYLKSMLQRTSRQVLTAGKKDEAVSDAGGPRPGHSIFTGHLMNALEGGAINDQGIMTANSVINYVAHKVSYDQNSRQSPHFGYFDGDGDFVFLPAIQPQAQHDEKIDNDILVGVPIYEEPVSISQQAAFLEQVKEYLAEDRQRIKLDTLVTQEIRKVLAVQTEKALSVNDPVDLNSIRERLQKYETLTQNLQILGIAMAYWGTRQHMPALRKIISRYADHIISSNGTTVWLKMQWYPVSILLYACSIAAIAAEKYDNLAAILTAEVSNERNYGTEPCFLPTIEAMLDLDRSNAFKALSEQNYLVPRSEYMFKLVQPALDDVLFLSKSYEYYFDQCETFLALIFFDHRSGGSESGWGPPGRFAYKFQRSSANTFTDMLKDAEALKSEWPPLKAGLFGGSYERFQRVAAGYTALLNKLNWW